MADAISIAWSYDASVAKMRPLVARWKSVTDEFLGELYLARDELKSQGRRSDLVADATKSKTWQDYCRDIGLDRTTVHRWLEQYDPETGTRIEPPKPEPKSEPAPKPKSRPAAPPDPEPEDATIVDDESDEGGQSDFWEPEDEPRPVSDADSVVDEVIDYMELLLRGSDGTVKHETVNGLIKRLRALSVKYNQEA